VLKIISLFLIFNSFTTSIHAKSYGSIVSEAKKVHVEDQLAKSVGRLILNISDDGEVQQVPLCTASLVGKSRDMALTAAHCFKIIKDLFELEVESPITRQVLEEENIFFSIRFGEHSLRVNNFKRHQGYEADSMKDLALIKLSQPAPSVIPVVNLPPRNKVYSGKLEMKLYGYNFPGLNGVKSVLKTFLLDEKLFPEAEEFSRTHNNSESQELDQLILFLTGRGRHACPGSSGGPIFIKDQGRWVQVSLNMSTRWLTCESAPDEIWNQNIDRRQIKENKSPLSMGGGTSNCFLSRLDRKDDGRVK
jgi:hypothetical protein